MRLIVCLTLGLLSLIIIITQASSAEAADEDDVQNKLRAALFNSSYEKRHLPTHDLAHGVNFSMTLTKIHSVDMFDGAIDMTFWMTMVWQDDRLQWTPADYGNIDSFRVPPSDIWIPDLTLYNSDEFVQSLDDVLAMILPDGTVYYIPPMRVRSACILDIKDFPYDTQVCTLKWGSWTHDSSRIPLQSTMEKVNLGYYSQNPIWDVVDTSAKKGNIVYFNGKSYEDVTFTVKISRKDGHGRIAAAVVTTWLILAVFLIAPSSATDRIIFAGFVFVSLVVLSASLATEVPSYALTSLGRFQLAGMLITAIIIALSAIIHRVYPKDPQLSPPSGDIDEPKLYIPPPSRMFLFLDIGSFLVTFLVLAIATGALFG